MANSPLQQVVEHMRRAVDAPASDAELLRRFLGDHDEAAFAGLVRRHGAMVLGVCRRIVGHVQDAEDAFQAVFLVLAKKAGSVGAPERLGNWLYGVAYRTALKAKARAARRRSLETQVPDMPSPSVQADPESWRELQPHLDQAISRLPEKYRLPVVLCDLEGRSRSEVALLLKLPEGTLSSRLATARRLLADRLGRRGQAVSSAGLGMLLADVAAAAEPPAYLVDSTVQAATLFAAGETAALSAPALALSREVMQAMLSAKLKFVVVLLLSIGILGGGAGWLTLRTLAEAEAANAEAAAAADKVPVTIIQGILQAVDAIKNTIVVRIGSGDKNTPAKDQTFTLSKDVQVLLADILDKSQDLPAGKLADLPAGTHVSLTLGDQKVVSRITARGPSVSASVKQADANTNTIEVMTRDKKPGEQKIYMITKDFRIALNDGLKKEDKDQEGKLANLPEGTLVQLQLSVDQKTALSARVQGGSISGTLKGQDLGNSQITITVKEDGGNVDKTYKVAQNARLLDLTEGVGVNLRFSVFDKTLVIAAQGQKK